MKLHYKTKPRPYQVPVLRRMVKQRGGGLNVPMRWGKTWIAINWAAALYHLEDVRRVLVVTVTSGLGVWEDQIQQHCPLPYRVLDHHGQVLSQQSKGALEPLDFLVVNYPNVWSREHTGEGRQWVVVANRTLKKFGAQAVVCDESHHVGNPGSQQSRHIYALARLCQFRLFMTGTMFHRKPFFVYGQMKFYDNGKTFGGSWTNFKDEIAIFEDPYRYTVRQYKNLDRMMKRVRPVVHIEENVPQIPTVRNRLTFDLTGQNLKRYQEMEKHKVLEIDGETMIAEIVLTQHLWLMMLAGGFIKAPSGKYHQIGHDKLTMAEDRLREYLEQDNHKIVVGCRFTPEIPAVAKVAKKLGFRVILFHGGVPKGRERHKRTVLFHRSKHPTVFVAQIAAAKEGIDLSAANTILWYSLTESYVDFDQFGDRINKFEDKRTLMHDYLIARGTRDEVTLEAMRLKMDVARFLVTNPRKAEKLRMRR